MYLSLIITFLLLLVIIITAIQNSMPLDFRFLAWNFRTSSTTLILFSAVIGAAIVVVLALPRLVKKSFHARSMGREIHELKKEVLDSEKRRVDDSHIE